MPKTYPCEDRAPNCFEFDPEVVWVEPSLLTTALVYTAIPAFLLESVLLKLAEHWGMNQVVTFFTSMPLLIAAWFYFIGWLLDRWRYKRALRKAATTI